MDVAPVAERFEDDSGALSSSPVPFSGAAARPASGKPTVWTSETHSSDGGRAVALLWPTRVLRSIVHLGTKAPPTERGWFCRPTVGRVLSTDAGAAMRAELSECPSSIVMDDAAKHLLGVVSPSVAPGSSSPTMTAAT
jgi:hypothetical protein